MQQFMEKRVMLDVKAWTWAKVLTLKPQGWNFDMGLGPLLEAPGQDLSWGGKEEAGDEEEGEGGKIFPPSSASPRIK